MPGDVRPVPGRLVDEPVPVVVEPVRAVLCHGIVVDQVVAGPDPAGERRVLGLHTGVEHGDPRPSSHAGPVRGREPQALHRVLLLPRRRRGAEDACGAVVPREDRRRFGDLAQVVGLSPDHPRIDGELVHQVVGHGPARAHQVDTAAPEQHPLRHRPVVRVERSDVRARGQLDDGLAGSGLLVVLLAFVAAVQAERRLHGDREQRERDDRCDDHGQQSAEA